MRAQGSRQAQRSEPPLIRLPRAPPLGTSRHHRQQRPLGQHLIGRLGAKGCSLCYKAVSSRGLPMLRCLGFVSVRLTGGGAAEIPVARSRSKLRRDRAKANSIACVSFSYLIASLANVLLISRPKQSTQHQSCMQVVLPRSRPHCNLVAIGADPSSP